MERSEITKKDIVRWIVAPLLVAIVPALIIFYLKKKIKKNKVKDKISENQKVQIGNNSKIINSKISQKYIINNYYYFRGQEKEKTKKTKKGISEKDYKGELEKKQENIGKKSTRAFAKKDFFQYLPHRIFFIFIFLIFSACIKLGFGYSFLTGFNLSFVGFLICFFSWIFLNVLKLWWEVSKNHHYFFSEKHEDYCLKEYKNCYCRTWKRKIARLFLISVIVFLFVCLLVKLFFLIN